MSAWPPADRRDRIPWRAAEDVVITDDEIIQKLAFRSPLPRLEKEGFYLFAQLEGHEQHLAEPERAALLARAYAAMIAHEESRSERPLPPVAPRAWRSRAIDDDFMEIEYACDLAAPVELRRSGSHIVGLARFLQGRVRLYRGTFAYFAADDLRAALRPESGGDWTPLG